MRRIDQFDRDAEREGQAIYRHKRLAVRQPQLRKTYKVDGFTLPTGNRHRSVIQTAC